MAVIERGFKCSGEDEGDACGDMSIFCTELSDPEEVLHDTEAGLVLSFAFSSSGIVLTALDFVEGDTGGICGW